MVRRALCCAADMADHAPPSPEPQPPPPPRPAPPEPSPPPHEAHVAASSNPHILLLSPHAAAHRLPPVGEAYPPISAQLIASASTLLGMMFLALTFLAHGRRPRAPRAPHTNIAAARPVLCGQILGAQSNAGELADAEELELIVPSAVVQGVRIPSLEGRGDEPEDSRARVAANHEHAAACASRDDAERNLEAEGVSVPPNTATSADD